MEVMAAGGVSDRERVELQVRAATVALALLGSALAFLKPSAVDTFFSAISSGPPDQEERKAGPGAYANLFTIGVASSVLLYVRHGDGVPMTDALTAGLVCSAGLLAQPSPRQLDWGVRLLAFAGLPLYAAAAHYGWASSTFYLAPAVGLPVVAAVLYARMAAPLAVTLFLNAVVVYHTESSVHWLLSGGATILCCGMILGKRLVGNDLRPDSCSGLVFSLVVAVLIIRELRNGPDELEEVLAHARWIAAGVTLLMSAFCLLHQKTVDALLPPSEIGQAQEAQRADRASYLSMCVTITSAIMNYADGDTVTVAVAVVYLVAIYFIWPTCGQWKTVLTLTTFLVNPCMFAFSWHMNKGCSPSALFEQGLQPVPMDDGTHTHHVTGQFLYFGLQLANEQGLQSIPICSFAGGGAMPFAIAAVPLTAAILWSRLSMPLAISLFTNFLAFIFADSITQCFASILMTVLCCGIRHLVANTLWRRRQIDIVPAIPRLLYAAALLLLILLDRSLRLYPDLLASFVQQDALWIGLAGLAFAAALYCMVRPSAVDALFVPFTGPLPAVIDADQEANRDSDTKVGMMFTSMGVLVYAALQDGPMTDPMPAVVPVAVVMMRNRVPAKLMLDAAILYMMPVHALLSGLGVVPEINYLVCVIGSATCLLLRPGAISRAYGPSKLMSKLLMLNAIMFGSPMKGNTGGFTVLQLRMISVGLTLVVMVFTMLQASRAHRAALARERAREEAARQAEQGMDKMRIKIECQQELMDQVAHELNSPIAALDLTLRSLGSDEDFKNRFERHARQIQSCWELILSITKKLVQPVAKSASTELITPEGQSRTDPAECRVCSTTSCVQRRSRRAAEDIAQGEVLVVLLVDDVACLRGSYKLWFENITRAWPHEIAFLEAENGEQCLDQVLGNPMFRSGRLPNVVVIDQYMQDAGGKMLGSETVQSLRLRGFDGLIIGCSGNAESELPFLKAGADHFWGKPAPPDQRIAQLLAYELRLAHYSENQTPGESNVKDVIQSSRAAWERLQAAHDKRQSRVAESLELALAANAGGAMRLSIDNLKALRVMLINEGRLQFGEELKAESSKCCLGVLLAQAKQMMTIKLETAGLTLNIQVQPSLRNSDIMTDPTMVTSILNNYISNAAKHSKSCISVLATAVEDCLRVEVHDDGPGVPPSFRDHLFRKYQRWEQLKDNVGLGLSSVASQSEILGGTCGYGDSQLLGGSMFYFEIPLHPDCTLSAGDASIQKSNSQETRTTDGTWRLAPRASRPAVGTHLTPDARMLVVDDSIAQLSMMRMLLSQHGVEVTTADTGEKALCKIKDLYKNENCIFSVVVCDLNLGSGLNGHDVARALRTWEEGLQDDKLYQPLVILSGDASAEAPSLATAAGADHYALKPVTGEDLIGFLALQPRDLIQPEQSSVGSSAIIDALQSNYKISREVAENMWNSAVPEIRSCFHGLKADPTQAAAHKLKGILACFYSTEASTIASKIETAMKEQSNQDGHEQIELNAYFHTLEGILEANGVL